MTKKPPPPPLPPEKKGTSVIQIIASLIMNMKRFYLFQEIPFLNLQQESKKNM